MASFSAKELAQRAGVDPKRMRSFIRKQADAGVSGFARCGQGNRYDFDAESVERIVAAFTSARSTQAHAPRTLTFETLSLSDARHAALIMGEALGVHATAV